MEYPTKGGYEFNTFATTAVTLSTTSSGTILAANSTRIYARVTNPDSSTRSRLTIWLGEPAFKTSGIFLDRGQSWETERFYHGD